MPTNKMNRNLRSKEWRDEHITAHEEANPEWIESEEVLEGGY